MYLVKIFKFYVVEIVNLACDKSDRKQIMNSKIALNLFKIKINTVIYAGVRLGDGSMNDLILLSDKIQLISLLEWFGYAW